MRHFIFFIVFIFAVLSALYLRKEDSVKNIEDKKIHVYASSSFIAKWGAGPALKEAFEKQNLFKIEYIDSTDMNRTLEKISSDGESSSADVVMSLDQFLISRLGNKIKWHEIEKPNHINFSNELKQVTSQKNFIPYNWAPLTIVRRQSAAEPITSLKDLLKPEFKAKIALEDPRTSTPGLQFLAWVFENKSSEEALRFIKDLGPQVHSYSPTWSSAYGLFKAGQTDMVFSYVTSPVYHHVEEKDDSYVAVETTEPLPVQVEFAGIPATCKNCEAAEVFVNFLLSDEAQKLIMSKHYMFPVIDRVKEGTPFDAVKVYKTLPIKFYEQSKVEKWINT
ncbi:MAG: thiamine ABC transporter substrate-binding protein, partial [Pseudobdellovibrio sp.]